MASFKLHMIGGILVLILFGYYLYMTQGMADDIYVLVAVAAAVIPCYSILPDVDQAQSVARRFFSVMSYAGIIILAYFHMTIPIILLSGGMILVLINTKHRGFFHSLWFGLLTAVPWILLRWELAVACFLSFLTHYMIDKFTKQSKFPY